MTVPTGDSGALPALDVVIAARNAEPFIVEAVSSALDQEGLDTRVVVVDDASEDGTVALVERRFGNRVSLLSLPVRRGPAFARNTGVTLGMAPWIAFLDADDLWTRGSISDLVGAVDQPESQIAVGGMQVFSDGGRIDRNAVTVDGLIAPVVGTTVIGRAAFEKSGGLDERLATGEFVDWIARARSAGIHEVKMPVLTLLRRKHAHNSTRNHDLSGYVQLAAAQRKRTQSKGHVPRTSVEGNALNSDTAT